MFCHYPCPFLVLRGEQTTWPPGYLVVTESQCHFCFFGCSFLFSYVFLFCILIKRGERPTWQLAWLRAKVNFVLFSCFYFWICFCFMFLICIVWKKRATDLTTRPPILVWLRTDVTARMISDAEAQKKPLNSLIFIFWNRIARNVKSD